MRLATDGFAPCSNTIVTPCGKYAKTGSMGSQVSPVAVGQLWSPALLLLVAELARLLALS